MTSNRERAKRKFRASKRWREFRNHISLIYNHKDPITDKKLIRGFSVHHLCLDAERYEELDDKMFVPLNKRTHEFIHWCYTYYSKDKDVLKRIKVWLDKMIKINN